MYKTSQLIIYRTGGSEYIPRILFITCPQKAVLRERGSSCKHLSVRVHTYIVTYVCSAEEKRGNNAAAFAIAPRRQWGKKRICVQSNRHTELNLPLVFLLLTSVSYKYHYAFIFWMEAKIVGPTQL